MPSRNRVRAQAEAERRLFRRIRAALVMVGLLILAVGFFFGDSGYLTLMKLQARRGEIRQEIASIRQENARLDGEIKSLEEDSFQIEKRAREDLGLGRQGELIFNFQGE